VLPPNLTIQSTHANGRSPRGFRRLPPPPKKQEANQDPRQRWSPGSPFMPAASRPLRANSPTRVPGWASQLGAVWLATVTLACGPLSAGGTADGAERNPSWVLKYLYSQQSRRKPVVAATNCATFHVSRLASSYRCLVQDLVTELQALAQQLSSAKGLARQPVCLRRRT